MNGDDHIKKLLEDGLKKFQLDKPIDDARADAPNEVPSMEELGYEYESNPVLKKRVEDEIEALKKK